MKEQPLQNKKISKIAYYHRTLQESDLDSFNVISGYKGFGKSNLAFVAAFDYLNKFGCKCKKCGYTWVYNKALMDDLENTYKYSQKCKKCKSKTYVGIKWEQFTIEDLWKYVAYSAEDVYDKIKKLEDFSPLCADEAVNFAMGEDWMYGKNKQVKNIIAKCRTKHLVVFMNIPKFAWLQSKYRDDMTSGWFRILRRGMAIFLIPDLGEDQDSWHLKEFTQTLGSYNIMTSKEEIMKKVLKLKSKHPCFFDFFWIPMFPDRLYKLYKKIRHYHVFQKEEIQLDKVYLYKLILWNLRNSWKKFKTLVGHKDYPSSRALSHILLNNPIRGRSELADVNVKKAIAEMQKVFDAHVAKTVKK